MDLDEESQKYCESNYQGQSPKVKSSNSTGHYKKMNTPFTTNNYSISSDFVTYSKFKPKLWVGNSKQLTILEQNWSLLWFNFYPRHEICFHNYSWKSDSKIYSLAGKLAFSYNPIIPAGLAAYIKDSKPFYR